MNSSEILRKYAAGKTDFQGINLKGIQLNKADLIGINFSQADLQGAELVLAVLNRVNLECR